MAKWQNIASLIILQDDHILMRETAQGWQLPSYDDVSFYSEFHLWLRRANADLNGDFSIVHRVWKEKDRENKIEYQWFYMENNDAQWLAPDKMRWLAIDTLETITLTNPIENNHLQLMLTEIAQPPHDLCPDFMHVGWFVMMRDWVTQSLIEQGYNLIRSPELFKLNIITALLRTETEQGVLYTKIENQNFPIFCNEAQILREIHKIVPQHIPNPLAIHPDNGMGIYADFGATLEDNQSIEDQQYKDIIVAFADLQKQTIDKVDELIAVGCKDRRLNHAKETFKQLIAHNKLKPFLTQDMYSQLLSQVDMILSYCDELASYNIPHTLSHGDFHEGNIALQSDKITFFDWTDACIAHPFLDICTIISFKPPYREEALFSELETIYLDCWTEYETPENIRRAHDLAKVASALHQIISYQLINQYSPPLYQSDFFSSVPHFTKSLLEHLELLS